MGWLCVCVCVCGSGVLTAMVTLEVSRRVDLLPARRALTPGHGEKGNTVYLCEDAPEGQHAGQD